MAGTAGQTLTAHVAVFYMGVALAAGTVRRMAWGLAVLHNKMGTASGWAGLLVVVAASAVLAVFVVMVVMIVAASAVLAVLMVMIAMIVAAPAVLTVLVVMLLVLMAAPAVLAVFVMVVVVVVAAPTVLAVLVVMLLVLLAAPAVLAVAVMVVAAPAVNTVLVVMLLVLVPISAGIAMLVCMCMSGAGAMGMMTCAVIIVRVFRRHKFYFHYDISSQYMNECSYVYLIIYILLCQGGNLGNGKNNEIISHIIPLGTNGDARLT